MRKNGFTLIEILSVIAILGIIAVIFVPNAIEILSSSETKIYSAKEQMIENAAKDYVLEHKEFDLPENFYSVKYITINTLVENNYIAKVLDASNGNECSGFVMISKSDTVEYYYDVCLLCDGYSTNGDYCSESTYNSI